LQGLGPLGLSQAAQIVFNWEPETNPTRPLLGSGLKRIGAWIHKRSRLATGHVEA